MLKCTEMIVIKTQFKNCHQQNFRMGEILGKSSLSYGKPAENLSQMVHYKEMSVIGV